MPVMVSWQSLPIISNPCVITSSFISPTVRMAWSASCPRVSWTTCSLASAGSVNTWVAPHSVAISSLNSSGSIATTFLAPAYRAPWTALMPTPPMPKITTVSPGLTLAAYTDEPQPVVTPQPTRQAISNGRSSSTFTQEFSEMTMYRENVPSTHIPPTSTPSRWNRYVSSSSAPVCAFLPSSQRFWRPVEQ